MSIYKMSSKIYQITVLAISIFTLCAFCPAIGYADTITGDASRSTEKLGDFIGEFTYRLFSPTRAELDVTLKNTSPSSNGGFLTGFVFNNPNNYITNVSLSGSNSFFSLLGGSSFKDTISASPFGKYDIGAALKGDFLGGGDPSKGISVGGNASFAFTLTGKNLDQLNTGSFMQARSDEGEFFVARFRGFNDGGSDKVPGVAATVPEPNIFYLLLFGLAGLVIYRKKLTKLCNVKMPSNKK
ncbi:MAG: hypothetical protein NT178_11385 [Proteobacteria bacterium]|nr:hypothetical protein [Pseudomonadota bacterium]